MSNYPISNACPQCGASAYRKRRFARECRACRVYYQPPTSPWRRWTLGLGHIIAGLLLSALAVAAVVGVASAIPAEQRLGTATDPFAYVCWGVFGAFGIVGLWWVRRGLKELLAREMITPPVTPPTSGARPVVPTPRMIPAGRAEALLRQVAERHNESAILRQLDDLRSGRRAGPVCLFAGAYFVVSNRRRCSPSERLDGAVGSFARECEIEETPLLFLDWSWGRDGRDGILLTNRRLYSSRLDGPIELQDVARVVFTNPSETEMLFKVLLFVIFLPLGAILILWGSWFSRRLLVNGEIVYEGRLKLRHAFWVDLLTVLGDAARQGRALARADSAAEAASMQGITRHVGLLTDYQRDMGTGRAYWPGDAVLEMFAHTADGAPLAVELLAAPSWEQVERGIRGLDGHAHPLVRLWAGQPQAAPGLEIIGGGKYALREVGGGWVYYDPNGADEEVEVQTSGAGHRCAGYYVCTNVERVLRIARRFFESGSAVDE